MSTSEKLLLLAQLVRDERDKQEPMQGYPSGAVIKLHSVDIEEATDIAPAEQAGALGVLADDYGCLEFTAKRDYADDKELEPETMLDIAEVALMRGEPEESVRRRVLEFATYAITVDSALDSVVERALDGALCELTIEDGVTPVVRMGGETYRLKALASGSVPQKIIEYASHDRYNYELNAVDFKQISAVQLESSDYNIAQIFKRNIFARGGALQDFAVITPKSFLLKKKSLLSKQALLEIKARSQA